MNSRDEPEFKNNFLREAGFKPYRCRKCGSVFWSLTPRETCPDRPCSKYDFLIKEYGGISPLRLGEARRKFIDYFTRNNHGYIDPYPVLARWRNDLYLTIASIIVFQPAVTEGIVEPPYNPLVIVQPSIRLEDIDEVGYTFGRHMTSFEMGGHHAFNRKNKFVYWVDETLRYAYEFFTKEIGIPPEDVVFKESWWEGGGNAGPAYEVVVDGLELATLVFMKYKVVDDRLVENPVLVVDTGYGIERITWFTQRTPTAFHAVFRDLVGRYKDKLSVEEPPHDVLKDIVYVLSDVNIKNSKHLFEYLKDTEFREYSRQVVNAVALYNLLDHGKTISLMLSDGIVPSNAGEGYLARLVIRRMLKTLLMLGVAMHRLEEVFLDLLDLQAKYWKGEYVYDKFHKHLDYILDVARYETRRFIDSLERGLKIVEKKIHKKKNITLNDLIEIYDSHGIPPEIVAEQAEKYGIEVNLPENFYSLIASRHGSPAKLVKEKKMELPREIVEWARNFEKTEPLFHKEPYSREFTARILGVRDKYIILDKTLFYPKAGGQDHDTGILEFENGEKLRVISVYKTGDIIIHELNKEPGIKTGYVKGRIDWTRRYILMRHHTATHIVLGAARRILGEHVWQAGAEKTVEKARLDITHYKSITKEELKRIEDEANKAIDEHIDVVFHYMDKFEAERKYGLRIYEGGAIISPVIRIVEIPGWDAEACFGVHVKNTSEVGGIKIVNAEKIQDGVIRLEFIASTRLPKYIESLNEKLENISEYTGSKYSDPVIAVRKIVEENENLKKILTEYRRLIQDTLIEQAIKNSIDVCSEKIVFVEKSIDDKQLYKDLLRKLVFDKKHITVLYNGGIIEIAVAPDKAEELKIDLRVLASKLREKGVRGGGKPDHITLRIKDNTNEILDMILKYFNEIICRK